jgi:hypothetical protein
MRRCSGFTTLLGGASRCDTTPCTSVHACAVTAALEDVAFLATKQALLLIVCACAPFGAIAGCWKLATVHSSTLGWWASPVAMLVTFSCVGATQYVTLVACVFTALPVCCARASVATMGQWWMLLAVLDLARHRGAGPQRLLAIPR